MKLAYYIVFFLFISCILCEIICLHREYTQKKKLPWHGPRRRRRERLWRNQTTALLAAKSWPITSLNSYPINILLRVIRQFFIAKIFFLGVTENWMEYYILLLVFYSIYLTTIDRSLYWIIKLCKNDFKTSISMRFGRKQFLYKYEIQSFGFYNHLKVPVKNL